MRRRAQLRRARTGTVIVHEVDPRASANTLIWNDRTVTYRLEGDLMRQVARDRANSFR
jgi:hypothetical protein